MTINKKEYKVNPSGFIFDIKTREMCKSCKRFGTKATCPPYVETIEYYKQLFISYNNAKLIVIKFNIKDMSKWAELGQESSLILSKILLKERNDLFKKGIYYVSAFGAGSCKNCEKCSFPCRFPDKSLIPLEGTGINVVKSIKKLINLDITFPVKNVFYRIGVLLW